MTICKETIESHYEIIDTITPSAPREIHRAVGAVMTALQQGTIKVAEQKDKTWLVNDWVKKAISLYFRLTTSMTFEAGFTNYYDKVPLQFKELDAASVSARGIRIVPNATVRQAAYIGNNVVLMPCFVNIGAYIGAGSMIDTWATVGSCAQIGKNVHISGGAGIGGVLEPIQSTPTIIEDNCFIGARAEIAEGVIVRENSVIAMGVHLGKSTKIYDRQSKTITCGEVPPNSVVVPGSIPSKDGSYSTYAAIIVKQRDAKTNAKTTLNTLLREKNEA